VSEKQLYRLRAAPAMPPFPSYAETNSIVPWAQQFHTTFVNEFVRLSDRVENMNLVEDFSNRPAADGTRGIYYSYDSQETFIDTYDASTGNIGWKQVAGQRGTGQTNASGYYDVTFSRSFPNAQQPIVLHAVEDTAAGAGVGRSSFVASWFGGGGGGAWTGVRIRVRDDSGANVVGATVHWMALEP